MASKTRYAIDCDKMTTAERLSGELRNGVIVYDTDLDVYYKVVNGAWEQEVSTSVTTGWGSYNDTQYTSVSPFTVSANTDTDLPNNKGNTLEIQKPADITTFYDGTVITGRNGDNLDIQIYFKAEPSVANQWLEIWIDITGGTGTPANLAKLYTQTFAFPKGSGVERGILYSLPSAYTLGTWEANGGVVKIRSNASVDIYNVVYNFDRSHKAI